MLHIVWLILQILLFTLLVLLGLAVVLVLLLLFVPVRYKVYAEKQENFICKLKASWLGFVFCLKARYDADGFVYWLRSFGGTLVSNDAGFFTKPDAEAPEKQKKRKRGKAKTDKKKSSHPKPEAPESTEKATREEYRAFAEDDVEFQKQPESFFTSLGKKLDKFVLAIKNKVSAFVNRVRRLKTKAEQYKRFLCANSTQQSLAVVKRYLLKLLAHLNPTKLDGRVTYGTGDPASTGEQLGMLSAFLPLYADKIDITPDFSQKILAGDLFIKGRVRVYNILYYVLKVYLNKYVKHSVAYFKKISGGTKE